MALIDLTNVDPYGPQVEAQARAQQASANMWTNISQQISQGIQAGQKRRAALEERNRAIRDREYAEANKATDKLVQAQSNHKYTDVQLQQVGQQFKQEFYDAVKEYQSSDKGDEARQKFEEAKQRSLGSARTISASIENLGNSMESFLQQAKDGGISDSMDPAVRSFFADLNDPATPADQFKIVSDEETGQLKYRGKTSDGHDVDFFLDDLANGENQFAPVPKANMPGIVQNLMKNAVDAKKRIETDWGYAEVTDWDSIGLQLNGRIDELLEDDKNFRSLAAGLGYGYEEIENAKNGVAFSDDQEEGAEEISSIEGLKEAMRRELMQQVELLTPHQRNDFQVEAQKNAHEQRLADKKQETYAGIQTLRQTTDFGGYVGKKAVINGAEGVITNMTNTNGVVSLVGRKGDKKLKEQFDINTPEGLALLQSRLTGQDYNLIKNSIIELDDAGNEIAGKYGLQ